MEISLYNVLGVKVAFDVVQDFAGKMEKSVYDLWTIDNSIPSLPDTIPIPDTLLKSGIYFLQVKSKDVNFTKKIILLK